MTYNNTQTFGVLMKKYTILILCLLLAVPMLMLAESGVKISSTTTIANQPSKITSDIWLTSNKLRIDNEDPGHITFTYDDKSGDLTIIDHDSKTFKVLDEKTKAKYNKMMKQLEAQLESLPESAREMMKEKMGLGDMLSEDEAESEVKLVQSNVQVGDYTTKLYEVHSQGALTSKMYVADVNGFGLDKADFQIFHKMAKNLQKSFGLADFDISDRYLLPGGDDVFAVKTEIYSEGEHTLTVLIDEIKKTNINADTFVIPSGYKQIDFTDMQR